MNKGPKGNRLCHPNICHFWHKNYFELKAIEKKPTQEKIFPLVCLRIRHKFTKAFLIPSLPEDKSLPEKTLKFYQTKF